MARLKRRKSILFSSPNILSPHSKPLPFTSLFARTKEDAKGGSAFPRWSAISGPVEQDENLSPVDLDTIPQDCKSLLSINLFGCGATDLRRLNNDVNLEQAMAEDYHNPGYVVAEDEELPDYIDEEEDEDPDLP